MEIEPPMAVHVSESQGETPRRLDCKGSKKKEVLPPVGDRLSMGNHSQVALDVPLLSAVTNCSVTKRIKRVELLYIY